MRSSPDARAWKRRRVGSYLGIAVSVIVHISVLGALAFGIQEEFHAESNPVANVELIRAWPSIVDRKPQAPKPTARRQTEKIEAPSRPKDALASPTPGEASKEPPVESAIRAPAEIRPIPPAQRLSFGCAHQVFMGLTAEERARCRDRFATRGAADHDYAEAGINPKARAAFDTRSKAATFFSSPFLSAMPTKGCRPRVTEHDAAAFGKSQPDVTVQATCVVHF